MRYIFFLIALFIFSSCGNEKLNEVTPAQLLLDLTEEERYINVDKVAEMMINKDPSLLLVDVRAHAEFDAFSLPGAVNIPFDKLLLPENKASMDCERFNVVFFSNDDLVAEQAWLLSRRTGCSDNHIMRGGLNEWTNTFLDPRKPSELATQEELDLYQFRRAVGQYFIGGSEQLEPEEFPKPILKYVKSAPSEAGTQEAAPVKKKIEVKPKPKKRVVEEEEEGC